MTDELPRVSVQDVLNCAFPQWYPLFKKHSIKRYIANVEFNLNDQSILVQCDPPVKRRRFGIPALR